MNKRAAALPASASLPTSKGMDKGLRRSHDGLHPYKQNSHFPLLQIDQRHSNIIGLLSPSPATFLHDMSSGALAIDHVPFAAGKLWNCISRRADWTLSFETRTIEVSTHYTIGQKKRRSYRLTRRLVGQCRECLFAERIAAARRPCFGV